MQTRRYDGEKWQYEFKYEGDHKRVMCLGLNCRHVVAFLGHAIAAHQIRNPV